MEAEYANGFGERKVGFGEWEVEPIIHQCDSSKRATYLPSGDFDSLIEPSAHPSEFTRAHPSVEYFAPLVVAWAASGRDQPGRRFATGLMYGNLETSGYAFGDTD